MWNHTTSAQWLTDIFDIFKPLPEFSECCPTVFTSKIQKKNSILASASSFNLCHDLLSRISLKYSDSLSCYFFLFKGALSVSVWTLDCLRVPTAFLCNGRWHKRNFDNTHKDEKEFFRKRKSVTYFHRPKFSWQISSNLRIRSSADVNWSTKINVPKKEKLCMA